MVVAATLIGTSLTGTVPPGTAGSAISVTVTDPDNGTDTLPSAFVYIGPLAVGSVDPPSVDAGVGGEVTITGIAYTTETTFTVNGVDFKDVQFLDARTVTAFAPPLGEGIYDVMATELFAGLQRHY